MENAFASRKRRSMKYLQPFQRVRECLIAGAFIFLLAVTGGQQPVRASLSPMSALWRLLPQNPTPFMHRPYYGEQPVRDRINSYFDHDKPWYADDGVFVRYDGKRWTGSDTSVLNCTPGMTCYDGHNGYDLHMRFEPVLSSASGTVVRAGWYNALNHSDGFGLWVAIDHGNGYLTVYGHLSAITVNTGEHVGTQWQIGTSGTSGSSTGPHLHFGTYYYPSWEVTDPFGWQGNYADPNIVPDHRLWASGTNNTPVPLLGDRGELLYPGAILVDDDSPAWHATGAWRVARSATDINGALHWANTTSGSATATATWQALVPSDGYYEVGAFVDDNHASSGWAPYTIYSSDPHHPDTLVKHVIRVDEEHVGVFQSPFGGVDTGAQWISLGSYYFSSTKPGRVVLSNATGESGLQVAADGIEFASLTPPIFGFVVTADNAPAQMVAGTSATVNLTLQNTSSFPWQAHGQNAVRLIYRWLDSQGKILSTSKPFALAQDLAMHGTESIQIPVQVPAQAGAYTLQWDLVQQGTQIFSKLGAKPKDDSVTVTSAMSQPQPPTQPTATVQPTTTARPMTDRPPRKRSKR